MLYIVLRCFELRGMCWFGITLISCGSDHMAALSSDGSLYTWGCGGNGRLGHGSEADIKRPQRVEGLPNIVYVSCGG